MRDTTRDGIVTYANPAGLTHIGYALREYLGGLRIAPTTFIEMFVHLPVALTGTRTEGRFIVQDYPRAPEATRRHIDRWRTMVVFASNP